MPERNAEPASVISAIAKAAGLPVADVDRLVAVYKEAVDELLADDYSICVPPLCVAWPGDPVITALNNRLESCSDEAAESWNDLPEEELAAWLNVSLEDVHRYLIATYEDILDGALERLGISVEDEVHQWPADKKIEARHLLDVSVRWIESFSEGREYFIGPAGLEREFEDWLVEHLEKLAPFGFPVEIHKRQARVAAGTLRPDLLCRFSRDAAPARAGDWLVIENKATHAYPEAVDQVANYVDHVRRELADGNQVFGLLLADGAAPDVVDHLKQLDVDYLSLASLGYRRRNLPERNPSSEAVAALTQASPSAASLPAACGPVVDARSAGGRVT